MVLTDELHYYEDEASYLNGRPPKGTVKLDTIYCPTPDPTDDALTLYALPYEVRRPAAPHARRAPALLLLPARLLRCVCDGGGVCVTDGSRRGCRRRRQKEGKCPAAVRPSSSRETTTTTTTRPFAPPPPRAVFRRDRVHRPAERRARLSPSAVRLGVSRAAAVVRDDPRARHTQFTCKADTPEEMQEWIEVFQALPSL